MEIFRKYFFVILLSVLIAIVWGGVLIYSKRSFSTVNKNAELYTAPLSSSFDEEVLNSISERIDSGYAIPPKSFFGMVSNQETTID